MKLDKLVSLSEPVYLRTEVFFKKSTSQSHGRGKEEINEEKGRKALLFKCRGLLADGNKLQAQHLSESSYRG